MYSLAFGIVVTAILALISLTIGAADMSLSALFSGEDQAAQVLQISRIPRTLAIMRAGSSLGIAGLVMQMIVRNRFVEPSTTGTTESAMLGFLTVTLLAPGWPVMAKMAVAAALRFWARCCSCAC
nr:iron chelate uptake ABC transporter family permease subunit [uncultured Paracoccus sp.]